MEVSIGSYESSEIILRLFFMNCIKIPICDVKNSRLRDDLLIHVSNEAIAPLPKGFETLPKISEFTDC